MSPELDKKLCDKYPKIFRNRRASMKETCMCWGFECGDGWYNLIDVALGLVQSHINQSRKRKADAIQYNRVLNRAIHKNDKNGLVWFYTSPQSNQNWIDWAKNQADQDIENPSFRTVPDACQQVVAAQVKEKFGGLRFYYDGGDSYIDGVMSMMGSMSYSTCELCGVPGKMNYSGWIRCLCDNCRKENE